MTSAAASSTARRALLFDCDGIIVDTEAAWMQVLIDTVAEDGIELGIDDVSSLAGVAGAEFRRAWQDFVAAHLGSVDAGALRTRMRPLIEAADLELTILPGVVELLGAAHSSGWAVGLGTGSERRRLIPLLTRLGIAHAFDEIVTVEDVERGKPQPDIYLELARRLGTPPSSCVVLEDSIHGAVAALAAGMRVIVCPCTVTARCEFPDDVVRVETLADVSIESLGELLTRASVRPRR
jgi:putative hydrolase of the HAD superfamily